VRVRGALIRRVRHWVANRGWRGFLAEVLRRAGGLLAGRARAGDARAGAAGLGAEQVHPFDRRYGVETSGLIWGERLGTGERREIWATGYYGISPSVLWQAMDRMGLEWPRLTFVDIGCGKGRAVMLALRHPFRRVIGVELSRELVRVAVENVERLSAVWRTDAPCDVIAGDATTTELPSGPLLLYLYHPFAAPVMTEFLAHVKASLELEPREMYLLYVNPEMDDLLRRCEWMERMWEESFAMEEGDAAADRFGSRSERVVAYRAR